MKNPFLIWTIAFVLVIISSCKSTKLSTRELQFYNDGSEMVAEARAIIDEISIGDFKNHYFENHHVYLIDVRTAEEFKNDNIKGSVSLPRGVLEFNIDYEDFWSESGIIPPEKSDTIVLYCGSGGRSALATKSLLQLGYKNVRSLDGGWNAWVDFNK